MRWRRGWGWSPLRGVVRGRLEGGRDGERWRGFGLCVEFRMFGVWLSWLKRIVIGGAGLD